MGPVTGPRGRAGVRGNTTARGAVCDTRHGLRALHEPDGHPSVRRERAAVDDPTTFTQPFTVALPMRQSQGLVYESPCHEGNYGMVNSLSGARAEEAASR